MAEIDENSLIGYDPLAWLHEMPEEQQIVGVAEEFNHAGSELFSDDQQSRLEPDEQEQIVNTGQDCAPLAEISSIVLEPVLNIQNVTQLHERLLAAMNCSEKIEIDASAVTVADTSTLQLLLILKRTAIKLEKEVIIDFPSDRFVEAADLLGISEMLEVDQVAAGFF